MVSHPAQGHALCDLEGFVGKDTGVYEVVGRLDASEGELQLQAHHLVGLLLVHAGLHDLFTRDQSVVAPVDIAHLGLDLLGGADQHGLAAGIVRMIGNDQPLLVQHLQNREFGEICELSVLQRNVRKQDGVGAGLAGDAFDLLRQDQPALDQMLDRISRASAEHAQIRFRDLDPMDSPRNLDLRYLHAPILSTTIPGNPG